MTIKGNLEDMNLCSIVTLNCNDGKQACLRINGSGRVAAVFFENGQVVHAVLDSDEGEEVVYELLTWEEGTFEIEQDVAPPKRSITTNWQCLLLEGMRRLDEDAAKRADSKDAIRVRQPILTLSSKASEQIGQLLCHLLDSVGGRCVLIAGRGGRLDHWQGRIDKEQAISLAALVSGSFSATAEIAEVLRNEGETRQFRQSLQEGKDFSIFSVAVGERLILSLCFNSVEPLGLVRVQTSKVASKIQEILKDDAGDEMDGQLIKDLSQGVGDALNDMFGD